MVFLACVHLALFLPLSLSTGNSLASSWCDHSMLASLLRLCLTISSYSSLHSFVFFDVCRRIFLSTFISKASIRVYAFFLSVHSSEIDSLDLEISNKQLELGSCIIKIYTVVLIMLRLAS